LTAESLEAAYNTFWTNIYYNDSYVFYKNAIEYYKNVHNSKFHAFFSGVINKKLFTGQCQFIESKRRTDFANNENIGKIDLDDLCNLSVQVINNLDGVFFNCPRVPFDLTVYRMEKRKNNDAIFKLKKGNYYKSLGYMSTSINPWYVYSKGDPPKKNKMYVVMTIFVPQTSMGYYMNHPFGVYRDKLLNKNIGLQEYEVLLPRSSIILVLTTKIIDDYFFIELLLKQQIIPTQHIVSIESKELPPIILTKKEYEKLEKDKYIELKTKTKVFKKDNIKMDIYKEYKKISKNKKRIDYDRFLFDLTELDNVDLLEWTQKKPKYNAKKYSSIPENKFDDTYKKFMDLIPLIKTTHSVYINVCLWYKHEKHNSLYNNIINNLQVKKVIKIKNPIAIEMSLSGAIFADTSNIVTSGVDKRILATNKTDKSYTMMIIIKYKKNVQYIPLNSDYGFTFGVTEIKITKVEKKNITNDVFYYLVEAI
jgi:hypothetical protein